MAKKDDAPTICPLLSMGNSGQDCWKEECWLYNRAMKKCALVHMAINMARIADSLSRENAIPTHPLAPKSDLDRRMTSLKKQHRLE